MGHRLVQALVDTGEYEVTVLDLYPPTKDRAFPPEVQFQQGDLTKEDDVMNACKGAFFLDSAFQLIELFGQVCRLCFT